MKNLNFHLLTFLGMLLAPSSLMATEPAQDSGEIDAASEENASEFAQHSITHSRDNILFDALISLEGKHEIAGSKRGSFVEYEVMSRGSIVTETWVFPKDEGLLKELTVFNMDNGKIRATHFCASGIVSEMSLVSVGNDGRYEFTAEKTQNQSSSTTAFNSGFAYIFEPGRIKRDEYWKEGETITTSHIDLIATRSLR
ncbi:hypothetical protein [Parasphingorhabdus halotolerans]|uniref:Uncharacterized protein n=1 Tax=Parasphingorhabdus halotolerans TaxID=2725558 RepID=A0A6H2DNE6_9SPHN|nr:hypothetical protein [Parasphingorhabdus halotolerans]QJB69910.1 hypothetical protein HF685_11955 [Parasphingorhabdus halotolerans]